MLSPVLWRNDSLERLYMDLTPIEFSADDNSVTRPENRSFICRPQSSVSDTAVLLIHGFTGTPWEMAPLAKHLATRGFTSVAVRLPGHGTSPEDLAQRRFEEWVEAATLGHQFLKKTNKRVIAAGLSTGAMISLAAHLSHPFEGLVLLSPYLKVQHRLAPLAGLLRHFIKYQQREISPEQKAYYYDKRPLEGVHQLHRLIRSVKTRLPAITIPTLVAYAEGDLTVDPESAIELYRQLGSQSKELHRFGAEVPHILTTAENPRQKEVLNLVGNFIETISSCQ